MMSINRVGLLQLYRFYYYALKMKLFIIELNIITNSSEEDRIENIYLVNKH